MEPQLIVTHPGSAHFDEMTAVSLLLAFYPEQPFVIHRRDPLPEELDNPRVWVIDTGRRRQPDKLNFDHHQALDCPASFVLVAEYLGLLDDLSVMTWWQFKDSVDRLGPVRASALFQAGDDLVNRNPAEEWLVDYFALDPNAAQPVLRAYGDHLISHARTLKKQIDYWRKARRLNIAGVPAMIGETRESFGLEEFRRLEKDPPDIVISLDRRGSDGWRLFRYEGARVDFSRLADCPEIEFAHQTGFLAKTKERLPLEKLTALVARAVITP